MYSMRLNKIRKYTNSFVKNSRVLIRLYLDLSFKTTEMSLFRVGCTYVHSPHIILFVFLYKKKKT